MKAHRLNHDWQTKPARSTHAVWVSSLESLDGEVCVCVCYMKSRLADRDKFGFLLPAGHVSGTKTHEEQRLGCFHEATRRTCRFCPAMRRQHDRL